MILQQSIMKDVNQSIMATDFHWTMRKTKFIVETHVHNEERENKETPSYKHKTLSQLLLVLEECAKAVK